jgi:hypothetical protein
MSALPSHAPPVDRVRANTWPAVNDAIDRRTELRVRATADAPDDTIAERLGALEREWDFDRVLEAEAPLMGLIGLTLGLAVDRRLLALPAFVSAMLVVHASQGWYPLLPIFRRLGVRSGDEIERERYALKALRGDFADVPPMGSPAAARAAAAWKAVCA